MSIRRWLQATENHPLLPKPAGDSGVLAANKSVAAITHMNYNVMIVSQFMKSLKFMDVKMS